MATTFTELGNVLLTELWEPLLKVDGSTLEAIAANPSSVVDWYFAVDPMVSAVALCAIISFLCWFVSVITGNYSQVDKLWSILPPFYTAHFYLTTGGAENDRGLLMLILTVVWGIRLTYNFARKGGYTGEEDYRWEHVRATMSKPMFQIFNITFIAVIQNILLMWLATPAYFAMLPTANPIGDNDRIVAAVFVALWLMETVADQQQWVFQNAKRDKKKKGEKLTGDHKRGFITSGLFRISRHPNFFAEQSIWWTYFAFSVTSGFPVLNWSILGAFSLLFIFIGSVPLTEEISCGKYPEYAWYQKTTSRVIPWFPGTPLDQYNPKQE